MLSDTTSALIEFVLQRKPVVTIDNNMPQAYMLNIQNASEIADALEKAAEYPVALLKEIDKFAEFSHPYEDGRSSARVIDACIDCLHRDKSHLKTKPLNLIRRYKIRKTGVFHLEILPETLHPVISFSRISVVFQTFFLWNFS